MSLTSVPIVLTDTDPPQDASAPFAAVVVAEESQHASPSTIRVRLKIANDSESAVEVGNPYDSLTYQITDAEGWPVTVPSPTRRGRVNGPRRSAKNKASYLALTDLIRDGDEMDVDEAMETERFALKSGWELEIGLEIPSVFRSYEDKTVQAPADGEYHVKLMFALEWFDGGERSSALVRTAEPLTINVASGPVEGH